MQKSTVHYQLTPVILTGLFIAGYFSISIIVKGIDLLSSAIQNQQKESGLPLEKTAYWPASPPDSSMLMVYSKLGNHQLKLHVMKLEPVIPGKATWSTSVQWKISGDWQNWIRFHHELENSPLAITFDKMKIASNKKDGSISAEETLSMSGRNP